MRCYPEQIERGNRMNRLPQNIGVSAPLLKGPLEPYVFAYAMRLLSEGYSSASCRSKIRLMGTFSRWLDRKRIAAHKVTDQDAVDFLSYYHRVRRCRRRRRGDPATLRQLMKMLCDEGVITSQPAQVQVKPSECLMEEYGLYLQDERALSRAARINYLPFIREFLSFRFGKGPLAMRKLRARDIIGFVRLRAGQLRGKRAQLMTTALRSFLRFSHYRGFISLDLAACVPAVANWSLSTIPRALPAVHVNQVLKHCNRKSPVGRRDYAILLLLARLGLRGGEVAGLNLDDIDWQNGLFTVLGKGGQPSPLPLPKDVGRAIAAYIKGGRPRLSNSRRVFLRAKAPVIGLTTVAVCCVVKRALDRAGIDSPQKGAHQFRHALATRMLSKGASLTEIGELLRHQNADTTRIYAKVDLASLRAIAMPWPGGVR
jgi:integrase/recombinase XerD